MNNQKTLELDSYTNNTEADLINLYKSISDKFQQYQEKSHDVKISILSDIATIIEIYNKFDS